MESDRQGYIVLSKQPRVSFKQGENIPRSDHTRHHTCCITVWSSAPAGRYMENNRSVNNSNRSRHRSQSISFPCSPLLAHSASTSPPSSSSSSASTLHPIRKRRTSHSGSITLTASGTIHIAETADNNRLSRSRSPLYTTGPSQTKRRNRGRAFRQNFGTSRSQYKMPFLEAHYHPFLFAMMMLCSVAELGLTSFLISAGNENGTWPSPRYHSLLILFCFNASWTLLFSSTYMLWYVDGASHFLANVASSVVWIMITTILWGAAAGIMHNTRTGDSCRRRAPISRCRQSLTVEAIGWTEFSLCVITLFITCVWVYSSRWRRRNLEHTSGNSNGGTESTQRLVV